MLEKIVMILALVATLGATGVFVYTEIIFQRPIPDNEIELAKFNEGIKDIIDFKTYKIEKFSTNLYSRKTRLRYLNLEVHIQPISQNKLDLLEAERTMIMDTIIRIAGRSTPEDLNTLAGKILFENRIKMSLNDYFNEPIVKRIFFSVFVIQ